LFKSKKNIAIGLVVFGFLYAMYDLYCFRTGEVPRMESESAKLSNEITTRKGELRRLQIFAQNIETVKQDLKELNVQLEAALEYMPRSFNLSNLLRKLTLLAQNSGVELPTFKPKKAEEKKGAAFYSTVSIDFDLQGTFSQTLVFLDQLSRLKRIVNVERLSMKTIVDKDHERTGTALAQTSATIRTYRFSE
jgi:type IV pilus assembly protein PilO